MSRILDRLQNLPGRGPSNIAPAPRAPRPTSTKSRILPIVTILATIGFGLWHFKDRLGLFTPPPAPQAAPTAQEILHQKNREAIAVFGRGDYASAAREFQELAVQNPNSPELFINWAATLRAQGQLEQAQSAAQKAFALAPQDARALNNMGLVHLQAGRLTDAETQLLASLKAQPDFAPAMLNLATLYERANKLELAMEWYHRYLKQSSADPSLAQLIRPRLPRLNAWLAMSRHARESGRTWN